MEQVAHARYAKSETMRLGLFFLVSTLFVHTLILIGSF